MSTSHIADVIPLRWRPTVDFPTRLRVIRKDYGRLTKRPKLTQVQFAEELKVNPNTYKQWESGAAKPSDLMAFARTILKVTHADPAWLLDVADDGPIVPGGQEISPRGCNGGEVVDLRARRVRLIPHSAAA